MSRTSLPSVHFPQFAFTGRSSKDLPIAPWLRGLLSDKAVSQVITHFVCFKMLVCTMTDIKIQGRIFT